MKIILAVVLLLSWSSIGAQVRPEYSGMWYNQDQSGHGLSIEVLDAGRSVGFWYRYDENGEPEWWLLQGTNHAADGEFGPHIKLAAYRFHGMIPGVWDPETNTRVHVTDVMVEFHDCNNITVYDVWDAPAIDMTRLTHVAGLYCGGTGATKMPVTLEDITREPWNMTYLDSTIWIDDDIVIDPDGTFTFGSGMMIPCRRDAQITVDETDPSLLHFTVTGSSGYCPQELYDAPPEGRFYENYYLCYNDMETLEKRCGVKAEAMVFPTSEAKEILFWRNYIMPY